MATGTNHWKLGLFVVVGLALAVTALVVLGARNWNQASVAYVSYFDESVQGLEIGSPVKFRGVSIGRVSAIDIAPDQRHVEVTSELTAQHLERLELGGKARPEGGAAVAFAVHPELRVQLAQTGITGVKFVLIDYFEVEDNPPPVLPFDVPDNYIPAAPSTFGKLESSIMKTAGRFPGIASDVHETVERVNGMVGAMEAEHLPERTVLALDQATLAMRTLNAELTALDVGALSRETRQTLSVVNGSLGRINGLLDRMEGDRGLFTSAQRSLDALSEVARGSHGVGSELELTMREVRSAARAIRRFAEALERDPDMLIKGRASE